jgi:Rap1a immunity proteins
MTKKLPTSLLFALLLGSNSYCKEVNWYNDIPDFSNDKVEDVPKKRPIGIKSGTVAPPPDNQPSNAVTLSDITGMFLLNKVKSLESSKGTDFSDGLFYGYLKGALIAGAGTWFSPPAVVKPDQAIKILKKYLNDHTSDLKEPALVLIIAAFMDAFPLSQKDATDTISRLKGGIYSP